MGKWSYEVEGWKGRHIKVNGLGWASIDDMFRAHNHDVEKMEKQIFDLATQNAQTQDENNRLDHELDEARKRIAELESPLRVPFSDDVIERMAKAAKKEHKECFYSDSNLVDIHIEEKWRRCIRAALAAGGLEPCADPADVALSTPIIADLHKQLEAARREVDEVRRHISVTMSREHQARKEAQEAKRQADEYLRMYKNEEKNAQHWKAKVEAVTAERDRFRGCYEQEIGEDEVAARKILRKRLNVPASEWPTKYISDALDERDDLRTQIAALHPGETVEGVIMARDHYRIQLQHESEWVRQYKQDRDDALAELEVVKAERDELAVAVDDDNTNAAAVIDVPAGVPSVEELVEIALGTSEPHGVSHRQVAAIRDAVLAGLAQPSSNAVQFDEVEALARVLREAYAKHDGDAPEVYPILGFRIEARAAIAHMRKRPEDREYLAVDDLPTRSEMEREYRLIRDVHSGNYNNALVALHDWIAPRLPEHMRKRPEGLPTADLLKTIAIAFYQYSGVAEMVLDKHDEARFGRILAALTPYLRDPVGWELDLQPHELRKAYYDGMWDEAIALIRSRIKPAFKCKECANWKAYAAAIEDSSFDMIKRINLARAALEGE